MFILENDESLAGVYTSNVIRNLINYIFLNPEKRRPNIIDVGVVNHSNLIPNQA